MGDLGEKTYIKGFLPYGLTAFLVGIIGGFTAVLGPAFVNDIGIDYNNTTWTALSMAISTAAFAPILGKLGDGVGRRTTLIAGLAVFTLGNVLTAMASSLVFMMIARFIVGAGTAAIAPVIMAYIVTEFPKEKMARGFSLYMLISSGAVIFGPTIGSLIIDAFDWRIMMWVCVTICVIIFVICFFITEKSIATGKPPENFDFAGSVMILLFFSMVLCIPSFGQNLGWTSVPFFGVLLGGVLFLIGLINAEKKAINPILSGRFMGRKPFVLSVAALFLTQGLMQANMTNVIVFVNYTRPENAVISGYAISIMYLGMSLGAVILGPLADRLVPKRVLVVSLSLTGVGSGLMLTFSENTSVVMLGLSLGILGFGLGANVTVFMKVVLFGLAPEEAGAGTGTYGLFRDLAAPFGVAVFVPMFTNNVTGKIAQGVVQSAAAVASIHSLAFAELLCIGLGIVIVLMLPSPSTSRTASQEARPR